jgi:hypothetical protein
MSHFNYLQNVVSQTKMEAVTDIAAGAAVASPWWLPYLKLASDDATLFLAPAGLLWFVVQIIAKIMVTRKQLRDSRK